MILSVIVAHDENNCIGKNNAIPWNIPADLKMFKEITMGKPVIMGRKTFESIGRPLPGRLNIVISRDNYRGSGICEITNNNTRLRAASSPEDAIAIANEHSPESDEIFIIGGQSIYQHFIDTGLVNNYYTTVVHGEVIGGDTFFPMVDYLDQKYHLEYDQYQHADYNDRYEYSFRKYTNIR